MINMKIDMRIEDYEDSIVEAVREELLRRSDAGIKKYNTTLDREDLSTQEWIQHAMEEAMDLTLYLKRIHRDLTQTAFWEGGEYLVTKKAHEKVLEVNDELAQEIFLKDRIITNLNKVILSQEQEILELKKEKHLQEKRRAWHY